MNNTLMVTAMPTEDDRFAGALGISKEREEQIDELMDKCHGDTKTYPEAIAAISDYLVTANELAYACFTWEPLPRASAANTSCCTNYSSNIIINAPVGVLFPGRCKS